jgi:hypothetical protein
MDRLNVRVLRRRLANLSKDRSAIIEPSSMEDLRLSATTVQSYLGTAVVARMLKEFQPLFASFCQRAGILGTKSGNGPQYGRLFDHGGLRP